MFKLMGDIYRQMEVWWRMQRRVEVKGRSFWDRGGAKGHGMKAKSGKQRNAVARRRRGNQLAAASRKYNRGLRNFGRCW